jgi:4-hydroxybenzoate polyprenyltransferase
LWVAGALIIAGLAIAGVVSAKLSGVVAIYFILTCAYSLTLKTKLLVDVITLASLYTLRIIAGAVAISVDPSHWLLAFSFFIFLSLALVKRSSELGLRAEAGLPDATNRNYRASDAPAVTSLAAVAGFNAVTVFALYISSAAVATLYSRPQVLWLACPLLAYWIGRFVMLAHRREMNDDPVVFALKDRNSLVTVAIIAGLVFIAM